MSTAASDMRQALISAGIDSAQIEEIVSKAVEAGAVKNDTVTTDDIDAAVTQLRKSLEGGAEEEIAKAEPAEAEPQGSYMDHQEYGDFDEVMKAMAEDYDDADKAMYGDDEMKGMHGDDEEMKGAHEDDEDDEDEDEDEDEMEGMGKSSRFDNDVVDIIAKSADDIVREVVSEHKQLAKSQRAIGHVITTLAKAIQTQATEIAALRNSLTGVADAVNAPMPPRSVTVAKSGAGAEYGLSAEGGLDRGSVMEKAMAEIKDPTTLSSRRYELLNAVSAIESGVSVGDVASQFSIN